MSQLLSVLEAISGGGVILTSEGSLLAMQSYMVLYYCMTAAAISFTLLTATQYISRLRNAACHKIQEIDRSVQSEIQGIKLHKEKLRAARMSEIHSKLAQKIREMLRESLQKHQRSRTITELSDGVVLNSKPLSIVDNLSPDKAVEAQQLSKNFNSFVEPANPFSGSIVENMPNSTKKFASSIKKPPRLDLISGGSGIKFGETSQGIGCVASDSQNYQVSMPSSLKRKLEIRSYNEARDNFFKQGFAYINTFNPSRRCSLIYTWSLDKLTGQPDILYEREPFRQMFKFQISNLLIFYQKDSTHHQISANFQQTKMAGSHSKIQLVTQNTEQFSSVNPVKIIIETPKLEQNKSPPGQPALCINQYIENKRQFQCMPQQQDSSGQTLQGDYLSPEQPSLVMSNASLEKLEKQAQAQSSQQPNQNMSYMGFQLLKCSPLTQNNQLIGPNVKSYAINDPIIQKSQGELQDGADFKFNSDKKMSSDEKSNLYLISDSEDKDGSSPQKTSSWKMKTASSSLSTLQGMTSNRSQMQEFKNIYKQILKDQHGETKQKCGISSTQMIPTLDFGKIEEIRQQELQDSSSCNQECQSSTQDFKQLETFGKQERKGDQLSAQNSKSQPRLLQNSFSQQEEQSLITYRSQSQIKDGLSGIHLTNGGTSDGKLEQHTQDNQIGLRQTDGKATLSRPMSSVAQTPDLISYTQSDLGKTSQHYLDNQEYLFQIPNGIVIEGNEHEDETHSSNENNKETLKQFKKPFDYDSKESLVPQFRHRSQQSQYFEMTLENAIDQKRQQFNQTVHDASKDKENSIQNSGPNTPKDSFVYSNSTQTAALNSQGPAQSNSKTPNLFKSSPYTTTPLEQKSNQLLNQDAQTQKQSISQFLTHSDLHMTIQSSFTKGPSLQSSIVNGILQGAQGQVPKTWSSSSHHQPSQSHELPDISPNKVVDKSVKEHTSQFDATQLISPSFSLLQKKIEAATKQVTTGKFKGVKLLQDTLSRNRQASRNLSDGLAGNSPQQRAKWRQLNQYSHSAQDQQISDDVAHIQKGGRADLNNNQGSFVGKINYKNQGQGHEHKMDTMEVGKSSRQNVQSISFNISSSMQSSPRSNLAFMNKLATSSNLFPSQHSIGASSETQPVAKQNQSNQSPSRSHDNTDKTLNSIQVPSTISHLQNDAIQVETPINFDKNQSKEKANDSKSPFDIHAKIFQPITQPSAMNPQNQGQFQSAITSLQNQSNKCGSMNQDLMDKVRMRKNMILGKEQSTNGANNQEGEDKQTQSLSLNINSAEFKHTPSSNNKSSHQKHESSQYWNTNVKDWSPIEYSSFGLPNYQHPPNVYSNEPNQIPGSFDYNNLSNNYYKGMQNFYDQNHGLFKQGTGGMFKNFDNQFKKTQKTWTPNSKNRTNDGSLNNPYQKNQSQQDQITIRRSAPSTQKQNQFPSAFPEYPQTNEFRQQNQSKSSLSNFTQSIQIERSFGNESSPQKQQMTINGQFSPQLMRKQQSRQVSRHRKRWSDGSQPAKWSSVKFPEDDKIDGQEILRRTQSKQNNQLPQQNGQLANRDLNSKNQVPDACSTGETPQKKKKLTASGGGAIESQQQSLSQTAPAVQDSENQLPQPPPTGSSQKQHKSGEKRSKRQLPPLAQRKTKVSGGQGSKLSQSHNVQSKSNSTKSFGFSKQAMTTEEKNKQIQDITMKLAQIKKKQYHLPLTSSYKHGSIFSSQRGNSTGASGPTNQLRLNQNKGKLLEVMSNNSSQRLSEKEKSKSQTANGILDSNGMKHHQSQASSQEIMSMQHRPLVWNPQKSSSLSIKRNTMSKSILDNLPQQKSGANQNMQQLSQKPQNNPRLRIEVEEEKDDGYRYQNQIQARPSSSSSDMRLGLSRMSFGMALQKSHKDRLHRPGNNSIDQSMVNKKPQDQNTFGQSEPQLAMQRKLQAMKYKKLTLVPTNNQTTYSSSNQSDNLSTYTDDAHELAELNQYFEAHFARVCKKPTISQMGSNYEHIENKILRTIKDLGEVHYLPVRHINTSHFLTGVKIINCEVVGQEVLVRVGGGYESLKHFVKANSRNFQRQITSAMRKSGRGINWVVDQFVQGQKHRINSQKSAVVAPAVTSPGRNHLYQIGANGLPLQSPTSMPSVPDAKFTNVNDESGSGLEQSGDQFLLNQLLLPHNPSPMSRNNLFFPRNRASSNSFKFPRSPAASNRTMQRPLRYSKQLDDMINPENR